MASRSDSSGLSRFFCGTGTLVSAFPTPKFCIVENKFSISGYSCYDAYDDCDTLRAILCVRAQLGAESTDDVDPVMGLAVLETKEDEGEFKEHVKIDTFDHRNSSTTASQQDKQIRHGSTCLFTCYASLNRHFLFVKHLFFAIPPLVASSPPLI